MPTDYRVDRVHKGDGNDYEIVPEIAPLFRETKDYVIGDSVVHLGHAYRFKANHTAGAFNIAEVDEFIVADELANKANKDGYYETLGAGYARQIQSSMYEEDNAAYNYRTAGGTAEIGELKNEMLVGGSLVWNQLVENGNFAENYDGWTTSSVTVTLSNGIISIVKEGNSAGGIYRNISVSGVNGHKYLALARLNNTTEETRGVQIQFNGTAVVTVAQGSGWVVAGGVCEYDNTKSNPNRIYLRIGGAGSFEADWVNVFDLTAMFGPEIADYIYALETANTGSGVAWFKRYFPKNYYAYHLAGFEHTQVSKHITTEFNQWDEEWEVGIISSATGENTTGNYVRAKNHCPCLPNTQYYVRIPSPHYIRMYWYDENKKFIGAPTASSSGIYTTPANCHYFRLVSWDASYGTVYTNDICISLHWDGERDGEYEAYNAHEYPLDDVVLRGIPKIDASGNLYFDGDTYEADGTVARRFKYLKLDGVTETGWNLQSINDAGIANFNITLATPYKNTSAGVENSRCNRLNRQNTIISVTETEGYFLSAGTSLFIRVKSTVASTVAEFKTWLASNNLEFVYEIATPITEEADPFTDPMFVDNWGTEQFVDAGVSAGTPTRDVEIPVGHETKYQPNLRAKIESIPDAPPSDGLWLVQMESGQASYVAYLPELPTNPTDNGSYLLKLTKSGSTVSLSWEAQE